MKNDIIINREKNKAIKNLSSELKQILSEKSDEDLVVLFMRYVFFGRNVFENQFVDDYRNRIRKFGFNVYISEKQKNLMVKLITYNIAYNIIINESRCELYDIEKIISEVNKYEGFIVFVVNDAETTENILELETKINSIDKQYFPVFVFYNNEKISYDVLSTYEQTFLANMQTKILNSGSNAKFTQKQKDFLVKTLAKGLVTAEVCYDYEFMSKYLNSFYRKFNNPKFAINDKYEILDFNELVENKLDIPEDHINNFDSGSEYEQYLMSDLKNCSRFNLLVILIAVRDYKLGEGIGGKRKYDYGIPGTELRSPLMPLYNKPKSVRHAILRHLISVKLIKYSDIDSNKFEITDLGETVVNECNVQPEYIISIRKFRDRFNNVLYEPIYNKIKS